MGVVLSIEIVPEEVLENRNTTGYSTAFPSRDTTTMFTPAWRDGMAADPSSDKEELARTSTARTRCPRSSSRLSSARGN